jgi:hypothetical protein
MLCRVVLCAKVSLSDDVNGAATKLIALKSEFPKADVFSLMASRPKTLLQTEQQLVDNAKKVTDRPGDLPKPQSPCVQAPCKLALSIS